MRTNKNTETQQQQYITVKRKTTRYNSVNIYMYLNACNAAKKNVIFVNLLCFKSNTL